MGRNQRHFPLIIHYPPIPGGSKWWDEEEEENNLLEEFQTVWHLIHHGVSLISSALWVEKSTWFSTSPHLLSERKYSFCSEKLGRTGTNFFTPIRENVADFVAEKFWNAFNLLIVQRSEKIVSKFATNLVKRRFLQYLINFDDFHIYYANDTRWAIKEMVNAIWSTPTHFSPPTQPTQCIVPLFTCTRSPSPLMHLFLSFSKSNLIHNTVSKLYKERILPYHTHTQQGHY